MLAIGSLTIILLVLSVTPLIADAHFKQAESLCQAGRWSEAARNYEKAITFAPYWSIYHLRLGMAYEEMSVAAPGQEQHLQASEHEYESVLRLAGPHAYSFLGLARTAAMRVQFFGGSKDTGRAYCRLAAASDPNNPAVRHAVGLVYLELGDLPQAELEMRRAVELLPTAESYADLGIVLRELGRYDEAIQFLRSATAFDPDSAGLLTELGITFGEAGRPGEAVAAFEEAIVLSPRNIAAHLNYARALAMIGRTREAISEYNLVLRMDPENRAARQGLESLGLG